MLIHVKGLIHLLHLKISATYSSNPLKIATPFLKSMTSPLKDIQIQLQWRGHGTPGRVGLYSANCNIHFGRWNGINSPLC